MVAAFAAAREPRGEGDGPRGQAPAGLAAIVAAATALLVIYRILQEPGLDVSTTVKAGAPLALILLGVIALSGALTLRSES